MRATWGLLFASTALLQATECVRGVVVVRLAGEPVSYAQVRIVATGVELDTRADAEGRFAFAGLSSASAYTIIIESAGFQRWERSGVEANCTAPTSIRAELEITPVNQAVTVEDRIVALRTDAPEISQTVSTRQIQDLPLNGRSWTRLALLDPHVRNTGGLGSDGSTAARLSINASSFRHTSYALDGNTNYDGIFANAPQQTVGLSAVQELKVLTNQYSAEYGTTTAGILVATTKAGTNDHHGEIFGFLRPSGIQAAPPVSPLHVPNQRIQSGAAVGGPLVRDRTHFFATYERIAQQRGSYIQSPAPGLFTGRLNEWYALARIDERWTDRHSGTLRVNGNFSGNNNVNDRVGGFTQPNAAQRSIQQAVGVQASERTVLGSLYNELRASYTNYVPSASVSLQPQISIVRPNYSTEGGSATSWVRAQNWDLANTAAVVRNQHQVKFGFDYVRLFAKDYSFAPFGEYRFAAGPPQPGERPQTYSQTFGAAFLRYGQSIGTAFIQDDYRVHPRLTLNLGLRYERQSLATERNNFAPRIGLAWALTASGNTSLRAGAGLFYDHYYMYITRRFYLQGVNSPTATYNIPFGTPGFPDVPNSLTAAPEGASAGKRDLYLPADKLYNPYSLQYSLGIQQRINDWVFSIDGIHQHTLRQMRANDINHPAPFIRTAPGQRRSGAAADATRPYETWAGIPVRNIIVVENSGSSLYDALDVGVMRRMTRRYQLEAHYVYSYSAAYAMFFGEPNTGIPNEWNDTGRAERGPSDFHQRHRFVTNSLIELPWRCQFSLITTVASGLPVNPLTGADSNGDTYSFDRPVGFGRNSYRAPAQASVDASFSKRWMFSRDRWGFEFRAEVFNLLNHNNYIKLNSVWGDGAQPNAAFLAPVAGVANVDPSRQFQAAIRVSF